MAIEESPVPITMLKPYIGAAGRDQESYSRHMQGKGDWVDKDEILDGDSESLKTIATAITTLTMNKIAHIYHLSEEYLQNLPHVEVADVHRWYHRMLLATEDGQLPFPPSNSIFSPSGIPAWDTGEGPFISYYLPTLAESDFVEECLHFLLEFYQRTEAQKMVIDDPEGKMDGEFRTYTMPGSDIIRAEILEYSKEQRITKRIIDEAVAYATRLFFGTLGMAKHGNERMISQIIRDSLSQNLHLPDDAVQIMLHDGIRDCYRSIYELNDVDSFDELSDKLGFVRSIGTFPSNLTHFLGYSLGEIIYDKVDDYGDAEILGRRVFRGMPDPHKRLDEITSLYV